MLELLKFLAAFEREDSNDECSAKVSVVSSAN